MQIRRILLRNDKYSKLGGYPKITFLVLYSNFQIGGYPKITFLVLYSNFQNRFDLVFLGAVCTSRESSENIWPADFINFTYVSSSRVAVYTSKCASNSVKSEEYLSKYEFICPTFAKGLTIAIFKFSSSQSDFKVHPLDYTHKVIIVNMAKISRVWSLRIRNLLFATLHLRSFREMRHFVLDEFGTTDLSLDSLSSKLLPYLSYRFGTYVELGAYNGLSQSNSLLFQVDRFWRGILIEPIPDFFSELILNRGNLNKCASYAAVSSVDIETVTMGNSGLMSAVTDTKGSILNIEEHLKDGLRFLPVGHKIDRVKVKCKTLGNILLEVSAPKYIDILFLDVEGQELEVLAGIEFSKYIFQYICIEARNIPEVQEFLSTEYSLVAKLTVHDYLFKRK